MRKTGLLIAGVLVISLSLWWGYQNRDIWLKPETTVEDLPTITVERGDITAAIFAVGNIVSAREANLTFSTVGTIKTVTVDEGDFVTAGDELATLDTVDIEWEIANAELNLAIAEAELAKLKAGPSEEAVASATASVTATEKALTALKEGSASEDIAAARAALDAARAKYNTLLAYPKEAVIKQAELQLEWAKNNLWNAQAQRDIACNVETKSTSLCDSYEAIVGSRHVEISKAELDLEQAKLPADQAEIQNALAQVQLAQANLDKLLAGPNSADIAAAEAQVVQAKARLKALTRGPAPEDVAVATARVEQARLSLERAKHKLSKTTLSAPFSGLVTTVRYQPGDAVGTDLAGIVLADTTHLQLQLNVAEVDISRVRTGQKAEIQLDAFPETIITGAVVDIAQAARSELGVVNYPVTISFDDNNLALKPGMTGNVNLITGQREDVLLVPNRAIRRVQKEYVVTILKNGQTIDVPVEIGLSNESVTEIISGLTAGDEVVLTVTQTQSGLGSGFFRDN